MRKRSIGGWLTAAAIIAWASAGAIPPADGAELAPASIDGRAIYRQSHVGGEIRCDDRSVVLAGNHTSLRLHGPCRSVRVAGEHNDIFVEAGSGSVIEITGMHNDVTWIGAHHGGRPTLLDHGARNTFHYADH